VESVPRNLRQAIRKGTIGDQPGLAGGDWQSKGHGFASHQFTLVENRPTVVATIEEFASPRLAG
jgi:hypothetical protein